MFDNDFEFIRADSAKKETLQDNDRLHLRHADSLHTGKLGGRFRTLSPIHIGTGQLLRPADLKPTPQDSQYFKLVAPFFRQVQPGNSSATRIIPGSSWRGVVRSCVELITYSGFPVANRYGRYGARVPRHLQAARYQSRDMLYKKDPQLDPATAMFGGQGYKTHVRCEDVTTADSDPWPILLIGQRWSPEVPYDDARKIYLHREHDDDGEEALEACPPGIDWRFQMPFHNLTDAQLGVLLLALGQHDDKDGVQFFHKLGGGKGQGIGSIAIMNVDVYLRPDAADSLLRYDNDWQPMPEARMQQAMHSARQNDNLFNHRAYDQMVKLASDIPDTFRPYLED